MAVVRSSSCIIRSLSSDPLRQGGTSAVSTTSSAGKGVGCWRSCHVAARWPSRSEGGDESAVGKRTHRRERAVRQCAYAAGATTTGHQVSGGARTTGPSSSSNPSYKGTKGGGRGGRSGLLSSQLWGNESLISSLPSFNHKKGGGKKRGSKSPRKSAGTTGNRYCRCEASVGGGPGDPDLSGSDGRGIRDGNGIPTGFDADGGETIRKAGDGGGGGGEAADEPGWEIKGGGGGGDVRSSKERASKVREGIWDIMSVTSKKLQEHLDVARGKSASGDVHSGGEEVREETSEWERWQRLFREVEERETLVKALKMQMQMAVDREDYAEAARVKEAIKGCEANNAVDDIMKGLKTALAEERYADAAKLRDEGFVGLVGWWAGLAEGSNDPYGRIVKISPSQGRFVGHSYTPRQLAAAADGTPVLEFFVAKEGEELRTQAVYLQREGAISVDQIGKEALADFDADFAFEIDQAEEEGESGARGMEGKNPDETDEAAGKKGKSPVKWDADTKKELSRILNYLKKRLPDIKVKMFHVVNPGGSDSDLPKIIGKLMGGGGSDSNEDGAPEVFDIESKLAELENESRADAEGNSQEDQEDESGDDDDDEAVILEAGDGGEEKKGSPIRVVVGAVHATGEDAYRGAPQRVKAAIEKIGRDSFAFKLVKDAASTSGSDAAPWATGPEAWKVAALAAQASADIMPDDVARVMFNMDKAAVKVSKEQVAREIGDMFKLAMAGGRRRGLAKNTVFQRINIASANTDPLSGIYIGAFGPHGPEVVQLRRCFGRWPDETFHNWAVLQLGVSDSNPMSTSETDGPYEYVEAVKLTGDLNVPAGQVTFRARIGKDNRLPHRGVYPEELGVVARYKGQGRLAEPGFKNPRWVDGELVQLNGKGGAITSDAELGFVFSVPGERHILVLFNRLKLDG